LKLIPFLIPFVSALIFSFSSNDIYAQNNAGKFGLEIVKAKFGLNAGPYRGRTPETDGPFDQGSSGFGQIYFPFQWSVDYRSNFSDSATVVSEYNKRLFLIRPSALFHVVDNESYVMGLATQFSFLIVNDFYLEYQVAIAYVEAPKSAAPDLHSGFNLHHFASISKPVSRHFSLSFGYAHISNAFLVDTKGSNLDVLTLGLKWGL